MAYWWVNHKQTAKNERAGGYIWSPKKEKDGAKNEGYLNLTRVEIGDIIFSYSGGMIGAIGIATCKAFNSGRPVEFGKKGEQWDKDGWQVNVEWVLHESGLVIKDLLPDIAPHIPSKYSPIQHNGNGNQKLYLTSIEDEFAKVILIRLPKSLKFDIFLQADRCTSFVESESETIKIETSTLTTTEKEQLAKSRVGQGLFRARVDRRERGCRITGVREKSLLIASHIKPWSKSSNWERLDGENGLLLSPHIDKLFDRGYLSFEGNGSLLVSDLLPREILELWMIDTSKNYGPFTSQQCEYLDYHRKNVYKLSIQ